MKESYTVFKKSILQLSLISKLYVWVYQTIGDYNLQMIETAQTTHSDTILKNVSQLLSLFIVPAMLFIRRKTCKVFLKLDQVYLTTTRLLMHFIHIFARLLYVVCFGDVKLDNMEVLRTVVPQCFRPVTVRM